MLRLVILLLAAGLFAGAAGAQTETITGTVTDAADGGPLPGANVLIDGTMQGASTDADGRYVLEDVRPGTHTLVVRFVGYQEATAEVTVRAGESTGQNFALSEAIFEGDEVVVSGSLRPEKLTDTPATMSVISARDVVTIPAYSPGELLARQKGVDYFRAGVATPAINVRGFNSNFNAKNLQVTDGRYSTLIATGLPYGPLDPTSAEDIARQEIVLGPNGALYGPNAHNGLVNTITKDPRTSEGTTINLRGGNQSTLSGALRHAQVLNPRLAFKANFEYSRAEEFEFVDSVYIGGQPFEEYKLDRDIEFIKGSAAAYYSLTSDTDIILNYGGSNSTYLSPTNVGRNQIKDWRIHVLQARFVSPRFFAQVYHTISRTDDTYSIDQRTKNYWSAIGAGMNEEEAGKASLGNEAVFVDDSRRWNAEAQYRDELASFEVVTGVQWQRDMANSHGSYLLDEGENDYITVDQVGGYGQVARDLPARFRFVGALRADNHEIYGFNLLPKAALLRIGDRGTWRLTYGKGIAAPTILNMYGSLFGGLILGNAEGFTRPDGTKVPKQKVEEQQTFELGYKGQLIKNRLFVDVNGYYNISKNFLSPATVIFATHRGDTPIQDMQVPAIYDYYKSLGLEGLTVTYINFGEFNTYGADLGLTFYLTPELATVLNYSFFDISFDENDLENNDFNGDGVVNKLDHLVNAPNNKASLAFNYDGSKFFGTTFFRWVEAYDYFSSFQIAAETQDLVYRGTPVVENARSTDAFNYGPLGGFVNVDVGVGYKVTENTQVSLQVSNLLDEDIREFTASPFIGRLYSIGVRAHF